MLPCSPDKSWSLKLRRTLIAFRRRSAKMRSGPPRVTPLPRVPASTARHLLPMRSHCKNAQAGTFPPNKYVHSVRAHGAARTSAWRTARPRRRRNPNQSASQTARAPGAARRSVGRRGRPAPTTRPPAAKRLWVWERDFSIPRPASFRRLEARARAVQIAAHSGARVTAVVGSAARGASLREIGAAEISPRKFRAEISR